MRIRPEYQHLVVGSKVGVGTQGDTNKDRLDAIADRMLVLDPDLGLYLPQFGSRCWLRIMHDSSNWKDPWAYAEHAAIRMAEAYQYGCRDLIDGNEQIGLEGLGDSEADYRWLNWWGMTHLAALRTQLTARGCPDVRIWVPAPSPGHNEDDNFEGFRFLAGYLNAADGIAVHYYWKPGSGFFDHADFGWWAGRILRAHSLIEGQMGIVRPWAVTEFNREVNREDPDDIRRYAAECKRYYQWANSLDYVVAFCTFLFCTTDVKFLNLTWDRMPGMLDLMGDGWDRHSAGEWEDTVTPDERERYYADLWKRWGAGFNRANAIAAAWADLAESGTWLGPPVEPEHKTENGQYVYQAFTGGILHCEVGIWNVIGGLPPLV